MIFMKKVSVSILNGENYLKSTEILNTTNADYIHLDVMDGRFVNNSFLTPSEMVKVVEKTNKKVDVHLMVNNPENYIKKLALYDINYITIHYEIKNFLSYLEMIKSFGFKAGVAVKPNTKIENIYDILDKVSLVLIMSVEPGLSGQSFILETSEKIDKLKEEIKRRNLNVLISVDGGITDEVLSYVSNADILVSSSFIWKDLNNISKLQGNL